MRTTVIEIKQLLSGLPDNLPVEFAPITMAFLGTMNPMRADEIRFFNAEGQHCLPDDPGAVARFYIKEGVPKPNNDEE